MFVEVILGLILISLIIWRNIQKPSDAPPGPIAFPIIGNLIQLAMKNLKHSYIAIDELSKKYGDVMTIRFGSTDIVILSSLEAFKETMHKDEWSGRIWDDSLGVRSFNKRLGLLFLDGELWREQRRFTIRHLRDVGFEKQESMELIIHEELSELMSRIRENMGDGYQTVLPMHNFFNLSFLNVLWTFLAGIRCGHDDEKLNNLLKMLYALFKSGSIGGGITNVFPTLRKIVPDYFGETEEIRVCKEIQDFIRAGISDHKESKAYGAGLDFIDIYLQEIEKRKENKNSFFTEDQLIILCRDLFVAGSETTSNTLSYAILYLILNPRIQNEVYEEIINAVGKTQVPRLEDLPKLKYTEAVLMEVQRISNIAPFTPPHRLLDDVEFRGYKIKKDTIVLLNLYSVHMDESYWGDPEKFRPERFLDSNGEIMKDDHLLPFGIGKRVCLGESLARMSLFIYFTTLMQNFLFETVPGHLSPSTEAVPGFTLSPQQFHAVVTCRNAPSYF